MNSEPINPEPQPEHFVSPVNPFSAGDVEIMLRDRDWLTGAATPEMQAWFSDAASLLGKQAAADSSSNADSRAALAELLDLLFSYDAQALLQNSDNQAIMIREGAREVIRELANCVLGGGEIDSDRYREIIGSLKTTLNFHGRKLFHPIRLALAGRSGEGDLDRVILLLDRAAKLPFQTRVKGARRRIIEFCAARA